VADPVPHIVDQIRRCSELRDLTMPKEPPMHITLHTGRRSNPTRIIVPAARCFFGELTPLPFDPVPPAPMSFSLGGQVYRQSSAGHWDVCGSSVSYDAAMSAWKARCAETEPARLAEYNDWIFRVEVEFLGSSLSPVRVHETIAEIQALIDPKETPHA